MNNKRKKDDDDENFLLTYATLRPFKKNKVNSLSSQIWSSKSFNELNFLDSYSILKPIELTKKSLTSSSLSLSELSSTTNSSSASSQTSQTSIESTITPISSLADYDSDEPEKIANCLNELDAYLDALDSNNFESTCIDEDDTEHLIDLDNHKTKIIPNPNFSTFPKKKSKNLAQLQEDEQNSMDLPSCSSPFQRGQHERNTIVNVSKSNCSEGSGLGDPHEIRRCRSKRSEPQRRFSWLRNSMRKTRPIIIPDQKIDHHIRLENPISMSTTLSALLNSQSPSTSPSTSSRISLPNKLVNNLETSPINNRQSAPNTSSQTGDRINTNDVNISNNSDVVFPLEIFENNLQQNLSDRPRQVGRRALTGNISMATESIINNVNQCCGVNLTNERPNSAPVRNIISTNIISQPSNRTQSQRLPAANRIPTGIRSTNRTSNSRAPASRTQSNRSQPPRRYADSEPSSGGSTRNPSPVSLISSTGSSDFVTAVERNRERPRPRLSSTSETEETTQSTDSEESNGFTKWPHQYGRTLSAVCCVLGLFNISRFAVSSIHFGANFILQFLILSLIFGIPMLWLQMTIGAKIKRGPITMWRISPICKGIGISLFIAQGLIALYTTLSLSWLIVYFRDSFSSSDTLYRWEEITEFYQKVGNDSATISERISDYFVNVVLQRFQLSTGIRIGSNGIGPVRFQLAFNLSILWMLVFIVLCKGLKSYGKTLLGLSTVPLIILSIVTIKLLTVVQLRSIQYIFPATDWQEFFSNSQSWFTAAQETFLTWNLFGISVLSLCSKSNKKLMINKKSLRRDAALVVLITIYGLFLGAVLGNVCLQILFENGYYYFSGSYERFSTDVFLYRRHYPIPQSVVTVPIKYLPRYLTVLGDTCRKPGMNPLKESGFMPMRLITEIIPATFSIASDHISPVWCTFLYLSLILIGLAQLCAVWKPIASVLGNSPSSVLLSCVTGLLLGIPLATESGLDIIHFLDVVVGGSWWLLLLWIAQIIAMFLIRGRPYSADLLVNDLYFNTTLSAFVAFAWNLLIPIIMMMLCVLDYKTSNSKEFFHKRGQSYWALWVRQIGGLIQVSFIILVPITSVIQIYRYLSKGPPDILDRIQLLYRPPMNSNNERIIRRTETPIPTVSQNAAQLDAQPRSLEDPPPKYTPPPSYTTATGARIAKMLRQSIRRSVRRIMGEPSRNRLALPQSITSQTNILTASNEQPTSLPPDYASVIFSSNQNNDGNNISANNNLSNTIPWSQSDSSSIEMGPRNLYNSQTNRDHNNSLVIEEPAQTLQINTININERNANSLNLCDNSVRRPKSHRTASLGGTIEHSNNQNNLANNCGLSISLENLVINAGSLDKKSENSNKNNEET